LVVVASPIGNLSDLAPRNLEALTQADLWIVEDTRVSGKLASHFGLKKPMRILNEHSTDEHVSRILQEIRTGLTAALLTDGGTPVVSDPGAAIVDRAYSAGIQVVGIPGPSAPVLALSVSGFYGQRFVFLGFLGRKPKDIRKELVPFSESPLTLVLFENVFRLETLLETAFEALGSRRYAVCREMTKAFEQVYRSELPSVPTESEMPRKGEISVVIEGFRRNKPT
jgi:16S rRNA (cytidine1402-2'-O)-methyltransferase